MQQDNYMKQIKAIYSNKIQKIIAEDPELAENQLVDNNYISKIINISHMLTLLRQILILYCGSFFVGIFWYIYCDFTKDPLQPNFIDDNGFDSMSHMKKIITLSYFAFTSLSTVGLGDYHPISDPERLMGAFVLLFGVSMTSFITQTLTSMIDQIRDFN
jgi:hypothetical protein